MADAGARPAAVGILLFPDVEVLDFARPYEVFSVAARIALGTLGQPPFEVVTIAHTHRSVIARHGLQVLPRHDFIDAPPIDILIVPGGVVTGQLADMTTLGWLRRTAARAIVTASVCTGVFLLAAIGLLDGLIATTHWEDIDEMRRLFSNVVVVEGVAYVDQGSVVTSAGTSAGIDMSLHLVGRLLGPELAQLTARRCSTIGAPAKRKRSAPERAGTRAFKARSRNAENDETANT